MFDMGDQNRTCVINATSFSGIYFINSVSSFYIIKSFSKCFINQGDWRIIDGIVNK